MNLNKFINISLLKLSKKYKITIVEITVAKKQKISRTYSVSYYELEDAEQETIKETFYNKRSLARWLMCLKQERQN